jgi:hypothetical protein
VIPEYPTEEDVSALLAQMTTCYELNHQGIGFSIMGMIGGKIRWEDAWSIEINPAILESVQKILDLAA